MARDGSTYTSVPVNASNTTNSSNASTTTNTTNTTNSSVPVNSSVSNDTVPSYYIPITLGGAQMAVYNIVNGSTDAYSDFTFNFFSLAKSLPISIYLLGFLNYFTLSSLYVLLNYQLPQQLYEYLSFIYQESSLNFLALVGLNI
jgi:hypothetical protein